MGGDHLQLPCKKHGVPPGVALMLYFDIIKAEIGPIVIATAISTIIVLVITGWTHIVTRKIIKTIKEKI